MDLRHRTNPINYKELHEGSTSVIPRRLTVKQERWSTSKLWPCQIVEDNGDQVKVHWDGWSESYDQWIAKEDAVDVPSDIEEADGYSHFTRQLYVQVIIFIHFP